MTQKNKDKRGIKSFKKDDIVPYKSVGSYQDVIKKYFPKMWENRFKVCIYCNQEIKKDDYYTKP